MKRTEIGWLLALGGGVAFAIATSVGHPGVAAPAWSIAALVAVAALGTSERLGFPGAIAAAGIAGACASGVLLAPGFPLAHDLPLHVWTLESFGRAVFAGDWNPRFHLSVGLGTPLGLFYPPLPFWFGVPFYAAGLAPAEIAKGVLVALHAASAASMAAAAAYAGRGRLACLTSGVAYAIAPYLLFDLHGRGALGEATALVFLPWLIAGFDRALRGEGGGAALAVAGIGLAHAHALALPMLAAVLPLAAAAVLAFALDRRVLALRAVGAGAVLALGIATGGHWIVPALLESDEVSVARVAAGSPGARYADFAPAPSDLFERRSADQFAVSLPRALRAPGGAEMPYYVGVGLLLAALAGARGARGRPGDLFALSLLGVGLALCVEPLAGLWGRVEPLARMQFPWRHLVVATPAAAWLAGSWLASLTLGRPAAALAGAALLLDAHPYLGVPAWSEPAEAIVFDAAAFSPPVGAHAPLRWDERPLRCEKLLLPPSDRRLTVWCSYRAYPEYLTPELLVRYWLATDAGDRDAARAAGVACEAEAGGVRTFAATPLVARRDDPRRALSTRVDDRGDVQVWEFAVPVQGSLRFLVAGFPGFRARDAAGNAIRVESCDGWQCLEVVVPTRHIELSLGTTPARRVGAWLAGTAALALVATALARRRAA